MFFLCGMLVLSLIPIIEFLQPSRLPTSFQQHIALVSGAIVQFFSMVPDSNELTHRYIAAMQVVKETSAEFLEAAEMAAAAANAKKSN